MTNDRATRVMSALPDRSDRRRRNIGQGRSIIGADRQLLPFPSSELLEGSSLFLDLDGTLLEIADRPDAVQADAELLDLLAEIAKRLDGRVALISGRSLEQIDGILGEIASELAVSGSHGCEHRWRGVWARPKRPEALNEAAERIRRFIHDWPGVLLEEKSFGVALHYRLNPAAENAARALTQGLAAELGLHLQPGKMMVELRVGGGDKGVAVHRLMDRPPMQGTTPVFAGDDATDEPGFVAARELGGHGILIGAPRPTAADYAIGSPAELRRWLAEAVR